MTEIHETELDTFFSKFEKRDVSLLERTGAGKTWYVICFTDRDPMRQVGFTDEAKARARFNAMKLLNQTE